MMTGRFSNSRLFKNDVLLRFCWQQSSAHINSVVQGLLNYLGIATHYNGHNRGSSLVNFVLQCSVFNIQIIISYVTCGRGLGAFRRWWPPSPMWAGPFNMFKAITGDVRIIPSFQIRGYVLHFQARFMCHYELWPTSVSHPFSFLNSSFGLTWGKHNQKITIAIVRLVLQVFAMPGYFLYIVFYSYLFSLLSSCWFVIAVCDSASVRVLVKS